MKQEFALLLVKVAFYLRLQFIFQFQDLNLLNKKLEQKKTPVAQTGNLQKFLLILNFNIGIGTDEIYEVCIILNVLYCKRGFRAYVGINLDNLKRQIFKRSDNSIKILA
jgi:hypothetical protein